MNKKDQQIKDLEESLEDYENISSQRGMEIICLLIAIVSLFCLLMFTNIPNSISYKSGFKAGQDSVLNNSNYTCEINPYESGFFNGSSLTGNIEFDDSLNYLTANPSILNENSSNTIFYSGDYPYSTMILYANLSCNYQGKIYEDKNLCVNLANFELNILNER